MNDAYCGTIRRGGRTTTLYVQSLPDAEWESNETFDLFYRAVGPAVVLGNGRAGGQITSPRT